MTKKIADLTPEQLKKLRQQQAARCSAAQDLRRMGLTKAWLANGGKWGFK
jgi:hypothetical protein